MTRWGIDSWFPIGGCLKWLSLHPRPKLVPNPLARKRSCHFNRSFASSLKTHRVPSSGTTGRNRLCGTGTYFPLGPSCSIDTDFLRAAHQNSGTPSAA